MTTTAAQPPAESAPRIHSPPPPNPARSAPSIPVYLRIVCGVPRWYVADAALRALVKEVFAYPTLTEEKKAALESLGVSFESVPDPDADAKKAHKERQSARDSDKES